jgi:hypothetical protein
VSRGQRSGSLVSVFYTGAATFLSCSSLFILTRTEWTPFHTHCYPENLAAPGIEPGTSGIAARFLCDTAIVSAWDCLLTFFTLALCNFSSSVLDDGILVLLGTYAKEFYHSSVLRKGG